MALNFELVHLISFAPGVIADHRKGNPALPQNPLDLIKEKSSISVVASVNV
jgi:hypothetical protein